MDLLTISLVAAILGTVVSIAMFIISRLQKRNERKEEELMLKIQAGMWHSALTGNGNARSFEPGSDGHRLAEKMVAKGMLNRLMPGYYTACNVRTREY